MDLLLYLMLERDSRKYFGPKAPESRKAGTGCSYCKQETASVGNRLASNDSDAWSSRCGRSVEKCVSTAAAVPRCNCLSGSIQRSESSYGDDRRVRASELAEERANSAARRDLQ